MAAFCFVLAAATTFTSILLTVKNSLYLAIQKSPTPWPSTSFIRKVEEDLRSGRTTEQDKEFLNLDKKLEAQKDKRAKKTKK